MKSFVLVSLICVLATSCADKPTLPVPVGAKQTADGARWILVRSGHGLRGADSRWWSVDWEYVPKDDDGKHVYNGSSDMPIYDPFRSNLLSMREGEIRRVWVPRADGKGYWVADLHLERVFKMDSNGEPIITND